MLVALTFDIFFSASYSNQNQRIMHQWTCTLNCILFHFLLFYFIIITIRKIIYCYCKYQIIIQEVLKKSVLSDFSIIQSKHSHGKPDNRGSTVLYDILMF